MEMVKISSLITDKISGEWGSDALTSNAVNVIRTANFTNSGIITFHNLVKREIESKVVEKKKLIDGDVIIEKSGGSPSQPVGRVVYFENPDDSTYLCNNFTTVLRPNRKKANPKYLFYLLYNFYQTDKVLAFQNKTTGIINLKLDRYLDSEISYEPDIETQNKIVAILDKAKIISDKREATIKKYDELLRATFLELFGNPMERPNRWGIGQIRDYIIDITAGTSYGGEDKKILTEDELGVLKISAVTKGIFDPLEYKAVKKNLITKDVVNPLKGDLLFSRANTLELVGATCIVHENHENLILPDKLWKVVTNEAKLRKVFLHFTLKNKDVRKTFLSIATGSSGSMLNISMEKFKSIEIPLPPIELQMRFETAYLKYVDIRKKLLRHSEFIKQLNRSLSKLAFAGELKFEGGIELEVLLDKDYKFFFDNIKNISVKTIGQLINRLDKNELNEDRFYEQQTYDKAKSFVFDLIKDGKVKQVFDKKSKKVKLNVE
ncbi:restriction endonuclease subunit S [Runella sp.]|uniref:restriction endonuclease subunit S n=1 Tax=Runella sp. TaxID=1960881 RepID=UPI003D103CB8